jgi:hypothetical protein
MQTAIKRSATVQSGHRIEITAPELPEGAHVEVVVMLSETPSVTAPTARASRGVADFLSSLLPVPRSAEQCEAIEREFQEERNAWDR